MLLTEVLARYAAQRIRFSDRSTSEYRSTLNNLDRWVGRPARLEDLNDDSFAGFLKHRADSRSMATARKDRAQLLTLWRWAWRKGLTETLPRDVPEVTVPRKRVRAWHPSEVAGILAACEKATRIASAGSVMSVPRV